MADVEKLKIKQKKNMDSKLDFLTKKLVDDAAAQIDRDGIPSRRKGRDYYIEINDKQYPFKLLITESAKLVKIDLNQSEFNSSEINRTKFEQLVGYNCKRYADDIDYFKIDQFPFFGAEIGKKYDTNSVGAKIFYDTRRKLQYLGSQLGDELNLELVNNYNERPDKMAGRGKGFVLKDYVLAGFVPAEFGGQKGIFIKLCFFGFPSNIKFGIDVDVDFYNKENPHNKIRDRIQKDTAWSIPVDSDFPSNWDELINTIKIIFQSRVEYLESFFSIKEKNIVMEKYAKLCKNKKQIILQGPPGTGKTYTAKDIAELMIYGEVSLDKMIQKERLTNNEQFKLIQFHPSYTYEDFVRGITAKNINGQIEYITEDKVIAELADKANKNFLASKKDIAEYTEENRIEQLISSFAEYIQDEIDTNGKYKITESVSITTVQEDAFRYAGEWHVSQRMKFKDLVLAQLNNVSSRREMKVVPGISGLATNHASYFFKVLRKFQEKYKKELDENTTENNPVPKQLKYVLIIDEINRANLPSVLGELIYALEYRGEVVNSMYALDGDTSIIIPDNLYIIGTMNTADRSVGHIDYAIRRRFAFESLFSQIEVIETEKGKEYFRRVEELFSNENLSSDFQNTKEDIQIGHSYFMGPEEELSMRMKYEVIPILKEYLKDGIFKEETRVLINSFDSEITL